MAAREPPAARRKRRPPPPRGEAARETTADERLLTPAGAQPFTASEPWRVLRIMGEFVEGFDALAQVGPAITLFGSARVRPDEPVYAQARETARLLGKSGFSIITGGGPGVMEAANRGARDAGVPSIGLNIELPFEQALNPYVDVSVRSRYFFVRKVMLVKYAQAFVIFPGGFGTMDELFEALTLIQTGKIRNFPVVLVGRDYWGGLLEWLRTRALAEGRIAEADLGLLSVTDQPREVCALVARASRQAARERAARAVTRRAYEP